MGDDIRSQVLRIISGECSYKRNRDHLQLFILSPWISDVEIELSELSSLMNQDAIEWFELDYNIKSINLPYALLLLKLHEGVEVKIVTLAPNEINYHEGWLRAQTLLDFLDEIGCEVFVNPSLHSKLLLANDLAILGSFNLSTSALYNREEIGVSIDDLENLEKLEKYCGRVIDESRAYGHTSLTNWESMKDAMEFPQYRDEMSFKDYSDAIRQFHEKRGRGFYRPTQISRGWLLDEMINTVFLHAESRTNRYGEFFDVTGGYDKFIRFYAQDLNAFYLASLRRLVAISGEYSNGKSCVKHLLGYEGGDSIDSILKFVDSRFARKTIPHIKLRVKSLHS
jgi:hypothetical protein